MASKDASSNALITTKPSEAALNVQLHPLVLLTISDYVTRHVSRQQKGTIIGAIVGQQSGRNVTLEHAYECKLASEDGAMELDKAWFETRVEQYKEVHKVPPLDFVGIFMLGSLEGPNEAHLQYVKQVQDITSTDSSMLLLFHPEQVDHLQGVKLPISLYESVTEQEGTDADIKFRELSFEVETGEAEMIGVDFVAAGAGTATAVPKVETANTSQATDTNTKEKKAKGKGKAKDDAAPPTTTSILSPEDEELIASLTAKANAIKMLDQRLKIIRAYLQIQTASYLTDHTSTEPAPETTNHTLLRSISAMLARRPLLAPPSSTAPATTVTNGTLPAISASDREKQDVHLTSLISSLSRSISEAQSMGSKFNVVAREKISKERGPFGGGAGRGRMAFGEDGGMLSGEMGGY